MEQEGTFFGGDFAYVDYLCNDCDSKWNDSYNYCETEITFRGVK